LLAWTSSGDYVYAAMAVSGLRVPVFYRGPTGPGSYFWFLLDNQDEFDLPAPSVMTTISVIMGLLQAGAIGDHRLAVRAYGARRGGLTATETADTVTLAAPDGNLHVSFDEFGRITSLSTKDD